MFDVLLLITVVFLIGFIIVAIYTIFTLCVGQKPSLCNKIIFYSSAICAVISTIMTFMVAIFPTFFFGDIVVKEQYRYNISAVEDNRDIAGRFGRSIYYTRGYVEQNLYYYVVRLNDGYKTVQKIPANKTRIIESNDETPRVVYYGEYFEKINESVGNNFRFNKDYYELYVPDNTVTDSWNIDMNG